MEVDNNLVLQDKAGRISVIELNHSNKLNPMSMALNKAVCLALEEADRDESIDAIVLTGGAGRSFCAGGDFKETALLKNQADVEFWLNSVVSLYCCVLEVSKPVVCAIDGYAIGMGFQLALCADWRIASPGASLIMLELEKGIACILGSAMLQQCFGRLVMTDLVYGCLPIDGCKALSMGLVNQVSEPDVLLETAIRTAERFTTYPAIPFRRTKSYNNAHMIEVIREAFVSACSVHSESFAMGSADPHFRNILGESKYSAIID